MKSEHLKNSIIFIVMQAAAFRRSGIISINQHEVVYKAEDLRGKTKHESEMEISHQKINMCEEPSAIKKMAEETLEKSRKKHEK